MSYSDSDLALIEMITYINGDVLEVAGIESDEFVIEGNIENILSLFDDDALEKLRNHKEPIDGALASGDEWASIIETLKSREDICRLEVDSYYPDSGTKLGICYTDPQNESGPIVTYKGTTGDDEWSDNIIGMNTSDTPLQEEALAFMETLVAKGYKDIIVVGQSKGGNKAMYVTILCDEVSRCVSLDGQGMSYQFMNKYEDEIKANSHKIINISLEDDYVHILLLQMMGIETAYVKGYGLQSFIENHSPNSFFVTDADGNIILDDDGKPIFEYVQEDNPNMEIISGFVEYIMDNASADEMQRIVSYLAPIVGEYLGNKDTDAAMELLKEDPDTLAMIVGLLFAYMKEEDISVMEMWALFDDIGFSTEDKIKIVG